VHVCVQLCVQFGSTVFSRIEVGTSPGTGKLKIAGGVEGIMKESINRAFACLQGHKVALGIGHQVDTTDFHVEGIDLLANRVPCECGIALVVAIYSAIKKASVQPGLPILGDLSIQGNIKSMRSLVEPLQIAMENGARRALIPLENKRNYFGSEYRGIKLSYVEHTDFNTTNNLYSLWPAREEFNDDVLLLEADLVFDDLLVSEMAAMKGQNVAMVDRFQPHMDGTVMFADGSAAKSMVLKSSQGPGFDYRHALKTVNIYRLTKESLQDTRSL
jgi:hypothetical protein